MRGFLILFLLSCLSSLKACPTEYCKQCGLDRYPDEFLNEDCDYDAQ